MSKSPFTFSARLWGALTAVFALWVVAAWLLTGAYQTFRSNDVLNDRSAKVEHLAQGLADDIQRDLARLHDIPKMVANDHAIKGTLSRWDGLLRHAPSAVERRKDIWTADATLRQLDRELSLFNDSLQSSVIFVMNAAGDCLASSNAEMADSFVGSNYASRDYFKDAMAGKKAHQFAVGKTSNIPGLYFSAPIEHGGRTVGVVAVKINLPAQPHWVNPAGVFISDANGVIILAHDKSLEMRSLPGSTVSTLSDSQRLSIYKRSDLPPIDLRTWPQDAMLPLYSRDDGHSPSLWVHRKIERESLDLHVLEPVPEILDLAQQRIDQFAFLVFMGASILLLVAGRIDFKREHKLDQKRLKESEQRYHFLFDNNPMPMWVFAEDSLRFIEVNDRALAHYGYSREEFSRMTLNDIRPPEDIPTLKQALKTSPSGMVEMEVRHLKKNGEVIDVSISTMPMRYDGAAARIVLIQDITQRKRAEAGIHQQLLYSRALNDLAKGVVEQDNPSSILEGAAHVISETLGTDRTLIYDVSFSKHQAIGMTEWLNPLHPEITSTKAAYPLDIFIDGARAIRHSRHWLVSHSDHVCEHLLHDGSGELLHGQMKIRSLLWYPFSFHDDGYYLLTLNHIYTHKEWSAEEIAFLDSVSQLVSVAIEKIRLLTEHDIATNSLRIAATAFESQEGMIITDADNLILRVNRAFTKITGYAAEEVVGKNPRIISSGRQNKDFYAEMWNRIKTTGEWEGEVWNRRKNGEIFPEYLTIATVKDSDDNITNYVGSLSDITLRKEAEEEIRSLAFFDPLTRLPNRRLLLDRLQQAWASSARSGREGALLFIDLDNFKTLNDTLGHDIGDLLLQQVAHRLLSCVRENDTVARLGGDEFVVMLEDLSEDRLEAAAQTEAVGEKILATLNQAYQLAGHEYRNTPSIGATLFHDHQQATEDLFKHADIAMYQAKKAGRNTLRFFDPQMQDAINNRALLEHELRVGLEKHQFHLYYQIQVDDQRRPLGAESLIRWIHPVQGLIPPSRFIPLAEETGLILPLGHWVLQTACAQLKAWQADPATRNLLLAVNVSAKQFRQEDFVDQVKKLVRDSGIDPTLLKLELTESMLQDNIKDTIATMIELKKLGVQFSLDDFGTGYSSLQYLKQLPLDQLKIDQSFVRDIADDSSDRAIVRTIIAMAQELSLDVIAEGVETEAQRAPLLRKGCVHYQGYLFGKPVPIEEFNQLLSKL